MILNKMKTINQWQYDFLVEAFLSFSKKQEPELMNFIILIIF